MQKVKYRQQTKFGCGSFALANLFDDHRFVLDLPEHHGERIADLNRKLNKFQKKLFLECMYLTSPHLQSGNRLELSQMDLFSYECDLDDHHDLVRPMIVSFVRENGFMHYIAVLHSIKDDRYYVVDSCWESVVNISLTEIIENLKIVMVAQFGLWSDKTGYGHLMMHRDEFKHIFE